jgi:hypothetical protein
MGYAAPKKGATGEISGLNAHDFARYWQVESEAPDYRVSFSGDTVELLAPKGLTLWRREEMRGDVTIEYDACLVDEGAAGDRVSDLNCFWMASDPQAPRDILKHSKERSGVFVNCYALQLYYMGYGGNSNTTTRFRRYTGDQAGVTEAAHRPAVLVEYTDAAHLNVPNRWRHIRLTAHEGQVCYEIDGERLVDYRDPQPLTSGWFGFRTTWARVRLTNFRYTATTHEGEPIVVRRVAPLPADADTSEVVPARFGVPFALGTVQRDDRFEIEESSRQVDFRPLAFWQDGSVKWGGFAGAVPRRNVLHLRRGGKKSVGVATQITQGQCILHNDSLSLYLPQGDSELLIDSIQCSRRTVMHGLKVLCRLSDGAWQQGHLDSTVCEQRSGAWAVVKLCGHSAGATKLPFVVRLYVAEGGTEVRLVHTVIHDLDADKEQIAALGLQFDIPMREALYNRHIALGTDTGGVWHEPVQPLVGRRVLYLNEEAAAEPQHPTLYEAQMAVQRIPEREAFSPKYQSYLDQWATWDGYRLSQLNDIGYTLRKRAKGEGKTPWIGTFSGTRAFGTAFVGDLTGGVTVALEDFWQSYPSTIEVSDATAPRGSEAHLTVWLWSPEGEAMDLRHYDTEAHGLDAAYEDVQPGMSTPLGIARTSVLRFRPTSTAPDEARFRHEAELLTSDEQWLCTPEYLHRQRAFGVWSLPNPQDTAHAWIEERLNRYVEEYREEIERSHWYGFWNYGDVMHTYDPVREVWMYDVGGFAWDNTELASNGWLWYSFLRTGRHDLWHMAVAMTRHTTEVDVYHIGPHAGLGSRHNVTHWGCGAKEARISQAAWNRFYYYLSGGDERTGDLMRAERDADTLLYHLDPMRLAQPRELYPCTAPARLRIGPDWLAYVGNWMTEWERTGDTRYRDRIVAGMESINALPHGIFTGPKALGYDPATGRLSYEGDTALQNTNHLLPIMGGFEVMNELLPMLPEQRAWQETWLDFCRQYRDKATNISRNNFRIPRLPAYAYYLTHDPAQRAQAWKELMHEDPGRSTNSVATWSLDAIYMLEVCP